MIENARAANDREPSDVTTILAHLQNQLDDLAAAVEDQQRHIHALRAAVPRRPR